MAKASGGTRKNTPATQKEELANKIREEHNYGDGWKITSVYASSKGYVATQVQRIEFASKSPNEKKKYNKEHGMCDDLAQMGFQIEHLSEVSGISSPDIKIVNAPENCKITINGEPADLKELSSTNNILRHAKDAIERQGAKRVVFKFPENINKGKLKGEIAKLKERNIKGVYYFEGHKEYTLF